MNSAARSRLSSMLMLVLLGCSGDPSGPNGGGVLAVTISGLPSGSAAAVSISGPNGFAQSLTSSQTFTALTAGSYTITASGVTVASTIYQASPTTQTLAVVSS